MIIGASHLGVPLTVKFLGDAAAPLRVFILCGQHGDERGIRRALKDFLAGPTSWPNIRLAILADANPDGAELRTRANAQGIDLNRDHILLRAPETRAIHHFVASWQPHLVLDLHNYPSRRRQLVQLGLRLGWDVCLDFPSHPATGLGSSHPHLDSLIHGLKSSLASHNFCFGRYTILDKRGFARHGTPLPVDARNGLTLRHGALTLLLEARNPSRLDTPAERRNLRRAVGLSLTDLLDWVSNHPDHLATLTQLATAQPRLPLRFRRPAFNSPVEIPVSHLNSGQHGTIAFPSYRPHTQSRRSIHLPLGYAVPLIHRAALHLLSRHCFKSTFVNPGQSCLMETTSIDSKMPPLRQELPLDGFVVFPCAQPGGRFLSLLLEAQSSCAVHRYPSIDMVTSPRSIYPIRRIVG